MAEKAIQEKTEQECKPEEKVTAIMASIVINRPDALTPDDDVSKNMKSKVCYLDGFEWNIPFGVQKLVPIELADQLCAAGYANGYRKVKVTIAE